MEGANLVLFTGLSPVDVGGSEGYAGTRRQAWSSSRPNRWTPLCMSSWNVYQDHWRIYKALSQPWRNMEDGHAPLKTDSYESVVR